MTEKIKQVIEKGNGTLKLVGRILETLLIAGIIGVITMWGASREMATEIKNMGCQITEMKDNLKDLRNDFLRHTLDERDEDHVQRRR